MPKTFRIWTNEGEPKDLLGDRVEFDKVPKKGMDVRVFLGKKAQKYKGVLALTEVMPPLIIERPKVS